ncbi:Uncharacterised protein [Burkholderia pseudomallei]|nr:Uncharacterised protein [Burkholderia pseudomallei]VCA66432.1 Uncharacterised protein [Burkholderia pseudomallei]VCA70814.1 Uncharacterised protein [Burkholderia pseudomallei]VCA73037.1 Uncharacterised protein [Burkholderia pseudomallei]VCA79321.1 Uncharacterised protein [Burkholderia pseudomallei]
MGRPRRTRVPRGAPAPQLVAGIVFAAAMEWGNVETVGVAFEHRGRTWAVHRPVGRCGGFCVSDVLTGRRIPGVECATVECATVEGARATAIAEIDSIDAPRWVKALGAV